MPRGVHGSGAGSLSTSRPRFVGCRPSASLPGSTRSSAAFSLRCLRQRQLHDVAGALGVGVQLVDGLVELGLADVGGQVATDRVDADLRAVGVLAAHVRLRAGIVADQHRAEARRASRGGQRRHPLLEVDEDLVACGLAVQCDRTHAARQSDIDTVARLAATMNTAAQCVHPGQARPGDAAQPHHQGGDVRGVDAERARHRRPDHLPPTARRGWRRHDDGRLLRGVARRAHRGQADLDAARGDARTAPTHRRDPRRGRGDQRADRPRRARGQRPLEQGQGATHRCGSSIRCRCGSPRRPTRDDIDDIIDGPRQRRPVRDRVRLRRRRDPPRPQLLRELLSQPADQPSRPTSSAARWRTAPRSRAAW